MIPVVTPEQMAEVDRDAPEPEAVLIERAGNGVAQAAAELLGGVYGKHVAVIAGRGNNGQDGRVAGRILARRGAHVAVVAATDVVPGGELPGGLSSAADLVIDAAYGTGLRRPYGAPATGSTPVLAVDIPSGISGLTGLPPDGGGSSALAGDGASDRSPQAGRASPAALAGGEGGRSSAALEPVTAAATVTFAALKPGLLIGEGRRRSGRMRVVDIGLGRLAEVRAETWLVTDEDLRSWLPPRPIEAHKWQHALAVVAGSPGMLGAPWLLTQAALRSGTGYVRLGMPGVSGGAGLPPGEVVMTELPLTGWDQAASEGLERFRALVVGPGLGPRARGAGLGGPVASLVAGAPVPVVIDADGLNALGSLDVLAALTAGRQHPTVITPHEGEYQRLTGQPIGRDRIAEVRRAAASSGAVVLLKGSTTVVAAPSGRVLLAAAGSSRLATAGTGDVLSGVIGALLALGVPALEAAAGGAHLHGRAAGLGRAEGLVASDLPALIARWLSEGPTSAAGRARWLDLP